MDSDEKWKDKAERLLTGYQYLPQLIESNRLLYEQDGDKSAKQRMELFARKLKLMGNAMSTLTEQEMAIYEQVYRDSVKIKKAIKNMGMSDSVFFRLKRKMLIKIAFLMGLDVPRKDLLPEWNCELFIDE